MLQESCPILSKRPPRARHAGPACANAARCDDVPFMHDPRPELRDLVLRHAPPPSAVQLLPRVYSWTSITTTPSIHCIYEPLLYFALQGTKRIHTGERIFEHGPGSFLIASVDVPVSCAVVEADAARPYAGVAIALDIATAAALLVDMPACSDAAADEIDSMAVHPTTPAMEDTLLRFLRLTDAPEDIPLLGPTLERELLYRVLQSPQGAVLRQMARADSRLAQIQRAVRWIRSHLAEPLPVERLAGIASMSVSSFHRHFKAVTGLSPLAYHKQMRLQEARRRLLGEAGGGAVASVAFAVGYESASQFSREYTRQFGMPPARDAARLRAG